MDEQQANDLAGRIREQFPHVSTVVVQSADRRSAPSNWLIGVQRKESLVDGISIHIHSELEWIEAVTALFVLSNSGMASYERLQAQDERLQAHFEEHKRNARLDAYHTGEE